MKLMRRIFANKAVGYIVFSTVFFWFALTLWWLGTAGPETVWAIVTSGDSGIDDHKYFPARQLLPGEAPFRFVNNDGSARIPENTILPDGETIGIDEFLDDADTVAFLISKNDEILKETYWRGYNESTQTLAFSMSKSFLSILIGAAIEDGYIQSVDQAVTDFVPEMAGAGFDQVSIRHLLQMTSGMDYVEVEGNPFSRHTRFYHTTRLEHELLNLELAQEPGQEFSYKTGENALLGLILSRALGEKTITAYTQERLWDPLGMEFSGAWNLDHPGGLEKTWCCLSATARDYAKLGRLYLNQGEWNGKQLIPAGWVTESTRLDTSGGSAWNYQYQWWLVTEDGGDFTAMGHLGQFVYVNPAENVVIVRLGTSMGDLDWDEWKTIFNDLARSIQ